VTEKRTFLDLKLDDDVLHTPSGTIDLRHLTSAEVVRHRRHDAEEPGSGYGYGGGYGSHAGGIGGAVIGGALAGPAGFLGGALLGSALDAERDASDGVARTVSATMTFESPELTYTADVDRVEAVDAETFVAAVKRAAARISG
jgi:hypothetical protein